MDSVILTAIDFEELAIDAVLTRSNQVVAVVDAQMTVRWISESAKFYGFDVLNRSIVDFIHPEDLGRAAQAFDAYVFEADFTPSSMANSIVSMRLVTASGFVPFDASGRWVRDGNGESWLVAILNDISTRHGATRALHQLAAGAGPHDSAQAIVEAAHGFGGVAGAQVVHHDDSTALTVGDLGSDPSTIDEHWPDLSQIDGPASLPAPSASDWCFAFPLNALGEHLGSLIVWGRESAPDVEFARAAMEPLLDLGALSVIRSRELAELNRRATTDHVTGLLNRHAFFASLDGAVRQAAVIYVDLDGFKAVNDQFGHTLGDHLLAEISRRLEAAVGTRDSVGRLGGDEFAIAHLDVSRQQAQETGERISAALNQAMQIDGHSIVAGASIGIAHTVGPMSGVDLIDAADQALLKAKAQGKGRVVMVGE